MAKAIIAQKLKAGDEIRIIAPARSMALLSAEQVKNATKTLEAMGLVVTFGKHVREKDEFVSSSIQLRVEDFHDAFRDKKVKAILTVIGGFSSNQILSYLDYGLIKRNPKILCGFSDITALSNAIYAKTGIATYSGPHFSSFSMLKGREYTDRNFKRCVFSKEPFAVVPAERWSDDQWWLGQESREFIKNEGYWVINKGKAEGTIIGGNLCTFNLLQGTEYMPGLKNTVLFLEDDEQEKEFTAVTFDRDLQSLIHQPGFTGVRGIVIGRFQKASKMTREVLTAIIQSKRELAGVPVVANVDFGHTTPIFTFPIGGKVRFDTRTQLLEILQH